MVLCSNYDWDQVTTLVSVMADGNRWLTMICVTGSRLRRPWTTTVVISLVVSFALWTAVIGTSSLESSALWGLLVLSCWEQLYLFQCQSKLSSLATLDPMVLNRWWLNPARLPLPRLPLPPLRPFPPGQVEVCRPVTMASTTNQQDLTRMGMSTSRISFD